MPELKLINLVDSLRDDTIKLCCDLVRVNTVNPYSGDPEPGNELAGHKILAHKAKALGASIRYIDIPEDIYAKAGVIGPVDRNFKDRPNLIADFSFGEGGKTIILNGHMDTVSACNMNFPPFEARISNGKIFGRGASDDKGGLTAALISIEAIVRSGLPLNGRIVLESVADEECSGAGAGTIACCLCGGIKADQAIVVDASRLGIGIASYGVVTAYVTVHGRAGHSSHGGINAIDKAFIIKEKVIDKLREEREEAGLGKVNLGIFNAGVHPSVVPSQAMMGINIFYSPKEAAASLKAGKGYNGSLIREAFEERVRYVESTDHWLKAHPSEIIWEKDALPFEIEEESPLVKADRKSVV